MDLGRKNVERDVERAAQVIFSQSQGSQDPALPTTTIVVSRDSFDNAPNVGILVNEVTKQQILVKYLGDCVKFTEQVRIGMPQVSDLLFSKNISDVQEAIQFFVVAFKFGVQNAIFGVRRMIVLIWSQEKQIRDNVLSAYKKIYLESAQNEETNARVRAVAVVKTLTELVQGATVGELISIEQLLKELMGSNDIESSYIQVLWERYSMKMPNTTPEESRAAIQLLGMLASSNEDIIRHNLSTLITVGLGDRAREDSLLVCHTCGALCKAFRLPKVEDCGKFFRLPKTHELFTTLADIVVGGLNNVSDKYYQMMCDEAVKVIFQLAENPDWICEQILRRMIGEIITECSLTSANNTRSDSAADGDINGGDNEGKEQNGEMNDQEKQVEQMDVPANQETGTQQTEATLINGNFLNLEPSVGFTFIFF